MSGITGFCSFNNSNSTSYEINGSNLKVKIDGIIYNTNSIKKPNESIEEAVSHGIFTCGTAFLDGLNGMFSGVIRDEINSSIYLFRDHLGIKPMFYSIVNNVLYFASEIKKLLKNPMIKPVITEDGLREIFGIGPAKQPLSGIFSNIYSIPPGGYGIFTRDGLKTGLYRTLGSHEHTDSEAQTKQHIAYLLEDAVKMQLDCVSACGAFLSGGIDSSIVTALAAKIQKKNGIQTKTFSFDFEDSSTYFSSNSFQPELDGPYVKKMVDYCGTNHTYLECGTEIMADLLNEAVLAHDLPCMADISSSFLYFCQEVKNSVQAAFTGECADEIFGGYPWFYRNELMNTGLLPWSSDINIRKSLLRDDLSARLDLDTYTHDVYKQSIAEVPLLHGETGENKRIREITYLTQKYFMATLTARMERISSHAGLVLLAPFADKRLVEYLWNIPWEIKYRGGEVKALLKDSFKGIVPDEILYRKKSPYPKSYNPGYEAILKQRAQKIIDNNDSPILSIIDREKIKNFMNTALEYGKPWFGQLMAGPQMLAYILQIDFWMRHYEIKLF